MVTFPANPVLGQVHLRWRYDGLKWIFNVVDGDTGGSAPPIVVTGDYLPLSGGTIANMQPPSGGTLTIRGPGDGNIGAGLSLEPMASNGVTPMGGRYRLSAWPDRIALWKEGVDDIWSWTPSTDIFDVHGFVSTRGVVANDEAVYSSNINDGFRTLAPQGGHARTIYTVANTRAWSVGVHSDGNFRIADESEATIKLTLGMGDSDSTISGRLIANWLIADGLYAHYVFESHADWSWFRGVDVGESLWVETLNAARYEFGLFRRFEDGTRVLQYAPYWFMDWNIANGEYAWGDGSEGGHQMSLLAGNLTIAGVLTQSDIAHKREIEDYSGGLDDIMRLRVRRFRRVVNTSHGKQLSPVETGFIHQEVRSVCEDWAPDMGHGGTLAKTIHSGCILAGTVSAVQELKAHSDRLEARLEKLERARG